MTLLGAGASVEAGIPATFDMSRQMIRLMRTRDPETARLLRFVAGGIQFHHGIKGQDPFEGVNVEELFAAIRMLANRHELEIAPFVAQWVEAIDQQESRHPERRRTWDPEKREVERHFRKWEQEARQRPRPQDAGRLVESIEALVHKMTSTPQGRSFERANEEMLQWLMNLVWLDSTDQVQYLVPLVRACAKFGGSIATLNYDNTIELAATSAGVPWTTGIDEWSETGAFPQPSNGIELLKLHGSIDWRMEQLRFTDVNPLPHERITALSAEEFQKTRFTPALVFGAGNKLTAQGPFLELLRTFRERLQAHDELLVIGYSFRDPHVNDAIFRWLNKATARCITVVEKPDADPRDNVFWARYGERLGDRCVVRPTGAAQGIREHVNSE